MKELDGVINSVKNDVNTMNSILDGIIIEYSGNLDEIMEKIYKDIICDDCPPINVIEKYFLELSNCLYFMCEKTERLGIYDSVSKAKAQEAYNLRYLKHQSDIPAGAKKPTVAESQAVSENAIVEERAVNDLYNKAYKIIKSKVASAETMVSTLSKILSHRIQEANLSAVQTGRRILNEETIF